MKFTVHRVEQATYVSVDGDIVAGVGKNLADLAGKLKDKRIILNLANLRAINSIGCREWATAIKDLASRHLVEMVECPVAFIDSCNLIPTMLGVRGAGSSVLVETFEAPYACTACQKSFRAMLHLKDVMNTKELPDLGCPHCGGRGQSELMGEDYLVFLDRTL